MPTTASNIVVLVAHVPVDKFEIVNGPSFTRCRQIQKKLERGNVDAIFTLNTPASKSSFRRTLELASIYNFMLNGELHFTAIFSGHVVSGVYNAKTFAGWFNLD